MVPANFLEYLQQQYQALVESIIDYQGPQQLASLSEAQVQQMRQSISASVSKYYESLEHNDPSILLKWSGTMLQPMIDQQVPLESILSRTAVFRRYLLATCLPAVAQGIPGSIEGTNFFMQLVDDSVKIISRTYQTRLQMFQTLAEYAPDAIGVASLQGEISYANPAMRSQIGREDLVGEPVRVMIAPESIEELGAVMQALQTEGVWKGRLTYLRHNGETFPGDVSCFVLRDEHGTTYANVAVIRDVSEQINREQALIDAEEGRRLLQEQVIEAQQAALAELSTPLIPISEKVTVMPLIGSIDSGRAQQIVERLLEGVVETNANTAIIDITGVPVVDTQVAQTLLRAAQAANLVGARVVLTGIRPEVAQTIVGLGLNMNELVTRSTLQSGIAWALGKTG